ncbi:unnamed protein product, partial [marine sediment metagenome]
ELGQGEDTFVSTIKLDPHDEDHIFIGFADAYNQPFKKVGRASPGEQRRREDLAAN